MLRVKTKLAESSVDGIGLFADQFIPVGTVTWRYDPRFDTAFDLTMIKSIPIPVRKQFLKYAYFDHELKKFVLCSDDQRFINHSATPNVHASPKEDVATRDIKRGEELTCDYTHFEHDWFERRKLRKEDFK